MSCSGPMPRERFKIRSRFTIRSPASIRSSPLNDHPVTASRIRDQYSGESAKVAKRQADSESDARKRGEQTLKMLTQGLTEAGVHAEGVMLFSDDVAKAILNTAKARGCTMIVLGLTGKGVLKRLIGGDVPANILKQADLPVLLCPANWNGLF